MACVYVCEGVSRGCSCAMPDSNHPLDSQCDKATPYRWHKTKGCQFSLVCSSCICPFPLLIFCREVCEWEQPNSEGAATWQLPGVVAADQLCSQLEAKLLHCLQLR